MRFPKWQVPTCVKVHKVHNNMSIGPMSMVACGRPTLDVCNTSELARRGVLYRPRADPRRLESTRDGYRRTPYRTELHGNMCNRPRSSGDRASLLPPAASTDETEIPDRLDTRMDEHERLVNGQPVRKKRISAVMRGPPGRIARAPRGVWPQAPWSLDGKLS
jgi:hypothetical protein